MPEDRKSVFLPGGVLITATFVPLVVENGQLPIVPMAHGWSWRAGRRDLEQPQCCQQPTALCPPPSLS